MRRFLTTLVAAVAVSGMIGCGSQDETVATITGVGAISKASVDHWTHVEFIVLHESVPTRPAPRGVVPDPPSYRACASYLKQTVQADATQSPAALTADCKQKEHEQTALTLNKLIAWDWTIGRAQALGLHASAAEVQQQLASVARKHIFYGPDLNRYLKLTDQTMGDLLLRSKVQLLESKIAERGRSALAALPKNMTAKQRQAAFLRLANEYLATKTWVARTSCRKGYVVPACAQYRGPEPPPGASA